MVPAKVPQTMHGHNPGMARQTSRAGTLTWQGGPTKAGRGGGRSVFSLLLQSRTRPTDDTMTTDDETPRENETRRDDQPGATIEHNPGDVVTSPQARHARTPSSENVATQLPGQ